MTSRSIRRLRALVAQLERFAGETLRAPASSDFMHGYRRGCSDTYRACADWMIESAPELADEAEVA